MKVRDESNAKRPITIADIGAIKTEQLNNMILIGENGLPVEYKNIVDLLEAFYQFRLPIFEKRKQSMLLKIQERIDLFRERRRYIKAYADGELKFIHENEPRPREDILANIDTLKLNRAFYIQSKGVNNTKYKVVPLAKMDRTGISELDAKEAALLKEYDSISAVSSLQMWKNDLLLLRDKYIKMYPNDIRQYYL